MENTNKPDVPKNLQAFMYALMEEARRNSFIDVLEVYGIDYDSDYFEIKNWFSQFGIKL